MSYDHLETKVEVVVFSILCIIQFDVMVKPVQTLRHGYMVEAEIYMKIRIEKNSKPKAKLNISFPGVISACGHKRKPNTDY